MFTIGTKVAELSCYEATPRAVGHVTEVRRTAAGENVIEVLWENGGYETLNAIDVEAI